MNNDFWIGIWVMVIIIFAGGLIDLKCKQWEERKTDLEKETEHLKGKDDVENY